MLGPFWDHVGEKGRSKKYFKNSAPPDANCTLLTCPEPPGQPPLFARYNLQLNSFRTAAPAPAPALALAPASAPFPALALAPALAPVPASVPALAPVQC